MEPKTKETQYSYPLLSCRYPCDPTCTFQPRRQARIFEALLAMHINHQDGAQNKGNTIFISPLVVILVALHAHFSHAGKLTFLKHC
eukprot:1161876-Pelagomonas_calceolata.AAC.5